MFRYILCHFREEENENENGIRYAENMSSFKVKTFFVYLKVLLSFVLLRSYKRISIISFIWDTNMAAMSIVFCVSWPWAWECVKTNNYPVPYPCIFIIRFIITIRYIQVFRLKIENKNRTKERLRLKLLVKVINMKLTEDLWFCVKSSECTDAFDFPGSRSLFFFFFFFFSIIWIVSKRELNQNHN